MDLSDWIAGWARLAPERSALCFEGRDLSYRAFESEVDSVARALAAAGVSAGGCVGFLGHNSPTLLALLFACARLGALFMPLNWRLAAPEHRQMLDDCPPALLVVDAPFVAQTESLRRAGDATRYVALGEAGAGWTRFDELLAADAGAPRACGDETSPLLLCYTSGSTGRPKGALLDQRAIFYNAVNSAHLHALTAADRVLTTLPLFHVGGLNNQSLPALHAGATLILHAKFDADAVFDAIAQEAVTLTCLVPAQIDMMMASPRWASADFSGLRAIATGSSIIPPRITRAVHAKGVPLVQIYGSTETCPIATFVPIADAMRKPGSAGKPAVHCAIRLVDEAGADVPQGATGEVWVKGPNVMRGYWRAPEASAAAFTDGWFHTGDMGYLDAEGFLFINGRKKEMIISGGENVYPAEIENVLSEVPGIAEVSVIGQPDERWGEIVVAVVVRSRGAALDEAAVLAALAGRIARYKQPRRVVFADALPRTALGKIRKEDVRGMVMMKEAAG